MDAAADTASVTFTRDELWLLRQFVRHEVQNQDTYHFPPASLDLNDQIAAALLLCETESLPEAALTLSFGDCLVVDASLTSVQDAKDVNGKYLGRAVLLKTFAARGSIKRAIPYPTITPDEQPSKADVLRKLAEREVPEP